MTDKIGGYKKYITKVTEEYMVLKYKPGCLYIGNASPASGSAKSIKRRITMYLSRNNIDTGSILAIGCDGTLVKTVYRNIILRLTEKDIGRPLQWLICLLLTNELSVLNLLNKIEYLNKIERS